MPDFKLLIIDADSIVYRCGFAAEFEELSHALHNVDTTLNSICTRLKCFNTEVYLKGEGNFRDEIKTLTEKVYKGTRTARKPLYYDEIREHMQRKHGAVLVNGMEADDKCSIRLWESDESVCLVSLDKDLDNTPGWHYNFVNPKKDLYYVDIHTANRNFLCQMLEGDRVDNISGLPDISLVTRVQMNLPQCKGVGKVTIKKLCEFFPNNRDLLAVVTALYHEYYTAYGYSDVQIEKEFFAQADLLYMSRASLKDERVPFRLPDDFMDLVDDGYRCINAVTESLVKIF